MKQVFDVVARSSRHLAAVLVLVAAAYAIPAHAVDAMPRSHADEGAEEREAWVPDTTWDMDDPAKAGRGGEVYAAACGSCHDEGVNRAPQRSMLALMPPESIHRALTEGVMKPMAEDAGLSAEDMLAVATFLSKTHQLGKGAPSAPLMCAAGASPFDANEPPPFAGWGLDPGNAHRIDTSVAGLDRAGVGKLKLKWAFAYPAAVRARSQPGIAGGALYVGGNDGTVFALDRATGCARWTFHASAEVRTAIVVAPWRAGDAAADPLAYFGDLVGNVYAIKARTGELVWKTRPEDHPNATVTAAPVLHRGRLYVSGSSLEKIRIEATYECCRFRGSVTALDAATGEQIWKTHTVDEPTLQGVNKAGAQMWGPSGASVWNSPAIDEKRNRLYIGTGNNYSSPPSAMSDSIIAMDLDTGRIAWHYQATAEDAWNVACHQPDTTLCPKENGPDVDFGAGTIYATASDGRDYVLAGQKAGTVYGIDPDTGKPRWTTQIGRGGIVGGVHFGMALVGDTLFVPIADAPDARQKEYKVPPNPGLYAVDIKTGAMVWEAPSKDVCPPGKEFCYPGYSGAIAATPELVLAGSHDGHLRIYDAASGEVLWDLDTARDFAAVNGATATGGSMSGGSAPLAYRGLLIFNTGYGFARKMPGNALLVFERAE
jgi:polyvinyl alcohol dehydrogenase (cytochrome)